MENKLLVSASSNPPKSVELLQEYVKKLVEVDVDMLHYDVMDGLFVKTYTYDYHLLNDINNKYTLPLDVHLMTFDPTSKLKNYIDAGATIITVHYEAYADNESIIKDMKYIKSFGRLAGLSICPKTKVEEIKDLLNYVDLVLIMSVVPGKSGQEFLQNTFEKLDMLNDYLKQIKNKVIIEVDGGINNIIAKQLKNYNVDIVVSGNYLYQSDNLLEAINSLRI